MFRNVLILLISCILLTSCLQNPSKGRSSRGSSTSAETDKGNPGPSNFDNLSNNFFQDGGNKGTRLVLAATFQSGFYLRGEQVHNYIESNGVTNFKCLSVSYAGSTDKTKLLLALNPQKFLNLNSNTLEYFWFIAPNDATLNSNYCSGLDSTAAFSFATVCPNCPTLKSTGMKAYTTAGALISRVATTNLELFITQEIPANSIPGTCSSSSECQNKGFDCCVGGLCVKDGQVKSSVNQSSAEFIQAQGEVSANDAAKLNYPHFYHLCASIGPTDPTDSSDTTDPVSQREKELTQKEELYNCIGRQSELFLNSIFQ